MTQEKFITNLSKNNQAAVIIGSLGTISSDLSRVPHREKILIKGAMGAALACGLGYALHSDREVIVLIGDGSFVMKLGHLATWKRYAPWNLRVIIIDNNGYLSCGGQDTNFHYLKNLPFEVFFPD